MRRTPLAALLLAGVSFTTAGAAPCGVFGVTIPRDGRTLGALERKLGCTFTAVRWFQDWREPFDLPYARALTRERRALEVSWQPRILRGGAYVGVPYRSIAAGEHDAYVRAFARAVRTLGRPVSITFAPEMNGDWGAYQLGQKNTPQDFVRAWRHLHDVFRQERANVRWVWTPNILYPTARASYRALYPGDAYVDEVGLDGYNWGTTNPWNRWLTFEQTFAPSIRAVAALTRKPIQLGEVSSAERGGSKAGWIRDLCRTLPKYPQVKRLFWFHIRDQNVDWRLSTSQAALDAFKSCVRR
ncbi:glycoside hydrolase family 26 protein [Deinococcus maricopensis]|uniref:Endoglucanase H/Glycosyl hydrolase family 26 n=1 Tax=Deinococcus maricopensis (strain DSM 21211 / LMG 22137 / NRRL B-23946 / LB-34) TaxID=709986 RepID=E8U370_DEIML|nr:glycosyl hydrolase [Deinococcus maricopensis]ADV66015.1 Endoglucanase H/Glycosyl hydrolase family 26 [Deinococcus maricopensis DSM 21211]